MSDSDRREFLQQAAGTMAAFTIAPSLNALASPALPAGTELEVAVVGAGRQGRAILAELQKIDGLRVVAVCDEDPSRLRSGLRRVQSARGYETAAELLAEEAALAAVVVATPTHLHRPVAEAALAAGKHVYCESPLASTVEDARALVAAARKAETVFQTGMQGRSNPIYRLARSFFRSGACKKTVCLQAQDHKKRSWYTPADDAEREERLNWRLDPALSIGLAGELGTQQFDVFHWFIGQYPTAVRGHGEVHAQDDGRTVADSAVCDVTFPGNVHLTWQATLGSSFGGRFELFCGTMATIRLAWTGGWMFKEADSSTQGWEVYANRETHYNDQGITLIAEATKLAAQGKLQQGISLPHPPLYYALADFAASVATGAPVACTAEDGLRAAVVGILANQAVVSGEEIAIDPALYGGE